MLSSLPGEPALKNDGDTWKATGTSTLVSEGGPPGEPGDPGDRYTLGALLGTGGMGEVRAAHDAVLRRDVAIKRLRQGTEGARARFEAEAQVTAQLDHPNIVPVHDLGIDAEGRPFLAMKRVRGRSLAALVAGKPAAPLGTTVPEGGPPSLEARLDIFRKVCDAIAFAHARGVLHRDLKTENVMVGAFGEVLVMDWGLARPIGAGDPASPDGLHVDRFEDDSLRTRDGQVAGTPGYMAPEQAAGRLDALDERTDVFGLGAVLYELLTGAPPATGPSDQVVEDAAAGRLPPLRLGGLPRELGAVVRKAMSPRPDDRYPSAHALREDIDAFLERRPLRHVPPTPGERLGKWLGRHRAAVRSATFVGIAATVALLAGLWRYAADVGEARDRALTLATRAGEAERDARRQLIAARLALADSLTQQGDATGAGTALRDADALAAALGGERRALDWALSAHTATSPPPVAVCPVHAGADVLAIAVSADGGRVASVDTSGRLVRWRVAGCEVEEERRLGLTRRAALRLGADGVSGILVGAGDLVNVMSAGQMLPAETPPAPVYRVDLDGPYGILALWDGTTLRVDLGSGESRPAEPGPGTGAVWRPSGALALATSHPTGEEEGGAWLAGEPLHTGAGIVDIAATPDGSRLVYTSAFVHAAVDLDTEEELWSHRDAARAAVLVSEDGRVLLAARHDGGADVERVGDGARVASLEGEPGGRHHAAAMSPDGSVVVLAGEDGRVRVHVTGGTPGLPVRFPNVAHAAAVSHDGRLLALGDDDGTLVLLDLATRAPLRRLGGYAPGVRHLRFRDDDRVLAASLREGAVGLFDLVTGEVRRMPVGGRAPAVDWLDAASLGVVSTLGAASRIDAATGRAVALGAVLATPNWDGAHVPGTSWMAVSGHSQAGGTEAVVVDLSDGRVVSRRPALTSRYRVAASPDGRTLATGTQDGKVDVWDAGTGELRAQLDADGGPTLGVAFAPDGRVLATTGFDGNLDLWDTTTWALLRSVPVHDGPGTSVTFSPDGRGVLTTGGFGAVWFPLDAHTRRAEAVAALSGPPAGRAAALAQLGWWTQVEPALDAGMASGGNDDPELRARARLIAGGDAAAALAPADDSAWAALVRAR